MKEESAKFLAKAERAIHAAETLLRSDDPGFAAGRAYYAMFHVASALLNERGLRFRKHSGVHSAFGEHFANTGALDRKFHRWLLDGFDTRIEDDYGIESNVTAEIAETIINRPGGARECSRG